MKWDFNVILAAERGKPPINYRRVADAIEFYQEKGFQYVEVPWIISLGAKKHTYPHKSSFDLGGATLTGSAEQSIIDAMSRGKTFDKVVMATPCFRDDDYDDIHFPSFFKVELFAMGEDYIQLIEAAKGFFTSIGIATEMIKNENPQSIVEHDLTYKGVEIGSYGLREFRSNKYAYGTGLAEPRLSVLEMKK